jgi:hypothetical protein
VWLEPAPTTTTVLGSCADSSALLKLGESEATEFQTTTISIVDGEIGSALNVGRVEIKTYGWPKLKYLSQMHAWKTALRVHNIDPAFTFFFERRCKRLAAPIY